MTNQEKFEREANIIRERNQTEMDMKAFLAHWSGYKEVHARHEKEIKALADKYEVDVNIKAWKLNGHWM